MTDTTTLRAEAERLAVHYDEAAAQHAPNTAGRIRPEDAAHTLRALAAALADAERERETAVAAERETAVAVCVARARAAISKARMEEAADCANDILARTGTDALAAALRQAEARGMREAAVEVEKVENREAAHETQAEAQEHMLSAKYHGSRAQVLREALAAILAAADAKEKPDA